MPPDVVVMEMPHDESQWQGWSRLSSSIHETRHFYDWVGTPLGMVLFDHLQRVVNEYLIDVGDGIATRDDVHIPLLEGPKNPRDTVMQRFLSVYRWNMDRYAWLMGQVDVPVGGGVEGLISLMPQENPNQPLPVAKMDHFDFGGQRYRWDSKLFPLGGRQIIEGIAFVVEQQYLQGLAPEQVGRFERSVLSAPTGWHYALPLFLMQAIVGDAPAGLVVKACEFALCVPGKASGPEEIHPGWRYIELLYALRRMADPNESGFAQTVAKLCETKKWNTPEASLRAACQYADAQVAHNQDNNGGSLVKAYNLLYYKLAAKIFRVRQQAGFPHASIESYLQTIDSDDVPKPPLKRLRQYKHTRLLLQSGYGPETLDILISWSMIEDLVHRITRSGHLACALKYGSLSGVCPIETAHCGRGQRYVEEPEGNKCPYGMALAKFGFL